MVERERLESMSEPALLAPVMRRLRSGTGGLLVTSLFGAGSRVVGLGSQVLALFAMTWLMPKAEFGDMMTVFAIYRVLSYGVGRGCAAGLLYHVARDPTDENEVRTHRTFALLGAVIVTVLTGLLLVAGPWIANFVDKPRLAYWIVQLAPFGIFMTLLTVSSGALDGRSRINESIFWVELLPNMLRLAILAVLLLARAPAAGVAWALAISVIVPWGWLLVRLLRSPVRGLRRLGSWDYHYCWRFVLHSVLSLQLQGADMIVAGYLFSSVSVADYAIAGRVAALFPFFQQITLKRFAPRAGYLIAQKDFTELERETNLNRSVSVASTSLLTGVMLAAAPWVLMGAGDFQSALALLVALAAPSYARAFFAGGEALLRMGGHASFSLGIMAASFLFVVLTPLALHQLIGLYSLPIGMTLSAVVLNPLIVRKVHVLWGFWLMHWRDLILIVLGLVICAGAAAFARNDAIVLLIVGLLLALPGALILWRERDILPPPVRRLLIRAPR